MASVRQVKEELIMNGELYNVKYKDFRCYLTRCFNGLQEMLTV